jgi:hypothetical protein
VDLVEWSGIMELTAMRRHLGVAAVDLRLVEAGLDHRDLGVVGHQQLRHPADRLECSGMGADPVGQRLGPARLGIGEIGRAQHRDKNLRRPGLAGEPVDDHRHGVAGVIDKQFVAAGMMLPHRDRQPRCPGAIQIAKPRVAVTARLPLDVLVPQDLQCDVLALQFAVNRHPVGFGEAAMTLLLADRGKQLRFQRRVGQFGRQWPAQPGLRSRCSVSRTVDGATLTRRAISLPETPAALNRSTSRTWRIAILPAGIVPSRGKSQRSGR